MHSVSDRDSVYFAGSVYLILMNFVFDFCSDRNASDSFLYSLSDYDYDVVTNLKYCSTDFEPGSDSN